MKFRFCLIFVGFILTSAFADNFVIKKAHTKLSRNKNLLKEQIGDEAKKNLHVLSDLNKTIAKVQIQTSKIQKQLFGGIEDLIDNSGKFKKGGVGQLNKSLSLLKEIDRKLNAQLVVVKNIKFELDKDDCFK